MMMMTTTTNNNNDHLPASKRHPLAKLWARLSRQNNKKPKILEDAKDDKEGESYDARYGTAFLWIVFTAGIISVLYLLEGEEEEEEEKATKATNSTGTSSNIAPDKEDKEKLS